MTGWIAALLGVVQGVFMFVPVSSTSHLALVQNWLQDAGFALPDADSQEMILFDLVVHAGTVVSIIVVMWGRLASIARDFVDDCRLWRTPRELDALRLVTLLLISTLVTGALGLLVRLFLTDVFGAPATIAVMLLITGAILWWTDRASPSGVTRLTVGIALGIGVVQSVALVPGLSRSGLTIAAALALGLRRQSAAEYSFLLAIPTILLGTLVQAATVVPGGEAQLPLSSLAIGFVVAAIVGTGSLVVVLKLLYAARFRVFTAYVWLLAVVVLAFGAGAT